MADAMKVEGKDIAIEDLVPLQKRNIRLRGFGKILSSIKAIGLIEPLSVYKENDKYVILNGFLRFRACEELGIKKIPCLIYHNKEAYTFNRMVNRLSPVQEMKMLRTALKTIDKSTIAAVFGIQSIKYRLGTSTLDQLHPAVIKALDDNLISRRCAAEFAYVNQERQLQMLKEMEKNNDYGISFSRALVIKTPRNFRNPRKKPRRLWTQDSAQKRNLVAKLEEIEKKHDFYTNLYRQYSTDLLKLCIYARKVVTNEKIRVYLESKFGDILKGFENIIFETEGKKAVE